VNSQRIATIISKAAENSSKCERIIASTDANRESIAANASSIQERRSRMRANQQRIHENQEMVAKLISEVKASN
jgi:ribosomal protein L17